MVSFTLSFLLGLLVIGLVQGAAIDTSTANPSAILQRREEIGHDEVKSLSPSVRGGSLGKLMKQYQPYLKVFTGCVPFPAVDKDGNVGGGLNPSGPINGDCSSSKGQVYVRPFKCGGRRAIMYAWYMPKDQVIAGVTNGHRHDWESLVVWLNAKNDKFIGMAASGHGSFRVSKNDNKFFSDGHPTVGYSKPVSVEGLSHRVTFTREVGGMQPMIDWARMTGKAQRTLKTHDFGDAIVPFKPGRSQDQLLEAWVGDNVPNKC